MKKSSVLIPLLPIGFAISVTTGAVTDTQTNYDRQGIVGYDRHGEPPCDSFQIENLLSGDGSAQDKFGISVALLHKTALIGAFEDRIGSSVNAGSAYIFEQGSDGGWMETAKLVSSDFSANDRFGFCVDLADDMALIGAYQDDDNGADSGSAYIFQQESNGQWLESIKLLPSDGIGGDGFGASVSISSSIAIIGAPFDDDAGTSSGSAYVFLRSDDGNWIESAKLTASDADGNDYFGFSVAIMGTTAMVGAWGEDEKAEDAGSVYIFEQEPDGTWIETAKLMASNGTPGDYFGYSLAMSESTAIVGAFQEESEAGTAYIFERQADSSWVETSILNSADGASNDRFGLSVDISLDTAIVGAYQDDDLGSSSGSAYLFKRTADGSWIQTEKLVDTSGQIGDHFGYTVAISGSNSLIGACQDDDNGVNSGSAYIIETSCQCPDTNGDSLVDVTDVLIVIDAWGECVSDQDCPADVDGDGIVNVNDLLFTISEWGPCE